MLWIAPSEKDPDAAALEKRLWDAADQFRTNFGLKSQEYSAPVLGLIFLRFAEVRFIARRAALTGQPSPGSASHPLPVGEGRGEGHEIERHGRLDFVLAKPPFNVNAVDKERLKDMIGPGRRFPFGLPRTDNATVTRARTKTKMAKPDRRSVGETELHYLWIQLSYSALKKGEAGTSGGRAGFVMANSAPDTRTSEQQIWQKLIESRAVDVMVVVCPSLNMYRSNN